MEAPSANGELNEKKLTFGQFIKRLRKAKGLTQEKVVQRILDVYSDVRSYRRIENDEQSPGRVSALAILVRGLELRDPKQINEGLSLGGYERVEDVVAEAAKAREAARRIPENVDSSPLTQSGQTEFKRWFMVSLLIAATLAAVISFSIYTSVEVWFVVASVLLYSSLYVISLLLETAYMDETRWLRRVAISVFCSVAISTILALFLDEWAVRSHQGYGLALSFAIFFAGAVAQWFIARPFLPDVVMVGTHTVQAAHAKNSIISCLLPYSS